MGSLTREHGRACYRAAVAVYRIASTRCVTGRSALRYAERVEAWEDEGGALPGGTAAGGRRAQANAPDSASG